MALSSLIGNEAAKEALKRMVKERAVPSTLLFCGPEGVGKKLFALAFAQMLMGEKSAPKIASLSHPDLHLLSPVGKSGMHPVENIRNLIDEASLPPYEAPVKVFLIDDAERMLPTSSNALLKTLEEPFSHSYFILVTSAPEALLPTIVSRSRKIPFFALSQQEVSDFISHKWGKTAQEARRIAFLSHGSLGKAKQLCADNPLPYREILLELFSLDISSDYPYFLKRLADIEALYVAESEEGPLLGQTDALLEEILFWYRDLHLIKQGIGAEHIYHLDSLDQLRSLSHRPLPELSSLLKQAATARLALQRSFKLSAVLEELFLHISH
jgi:DNA polymerase-3 subunit delta'